jgi:hypothetical protein
MGLVESITERLFMPAHLILNRPTNMFSDNPALQHLSDSDKARLWELTLWISEHADQTVGWTQLMRGTHMSQWELNALLAKINTNPMAYLKSVKEYLKYENQGAFATSPVPQTFNRIAQHV